MSFYCVVCIGSHDVHMIFFYSANLLFVISLVFSCQKMFYVVDSFLYLSICSLPALHQKFDLPAPFVLHTDCPHYWRFHLPGSYRMLEIIFFETSIIYFLNWILGETEEEFSTRLANNLENLILKEGPDTVTVPLSHPLDDIFGWLLRMFMLI